MSIGAAFKNFSIGSKSREPSRIREPTSQGPVIDKKENKQQSIVVEQSEKERRAFVPDADAAAAAAASDAEAGTAQLWTGRFPTRISTGHIIGFRNTLAAGDVIGSSSPARRRIDVSAGNLVRLPQHGDAAGDEQTRFIRVISDYGRQAQQVGSDDLRDESVQAQEEYKPRDLSPRRGLVTGNWVINVVAAAAAAAAAVRGETGSQPGAQVKNGQLQQARTGDSDADEDGKSDVIRIMFMLQGLFFKSSLYTLRACLDFSCLKCLLGCDVGSLMVLAYCEHRLTGEPVHAAMFLQKDTSNRSWQFGRLSGLI
ncbi:hypothetical protein NEUTE1DRAFT_134025 [Neurospora tetrasperma FGSC 2508]|uniref:Uncharacterized protein n=1 Tax=Neurospora tetrasperma (strain FGSC 2508 / ATCC MYA-4615 / P0657) TaxID=510951 RepID=F8MZL7_NEUT8|nr:uncharacterized protein NEUTE1DRAFT_134025 [Neurospora tetrasperma FGSC 2508]EGO53707.1 hypothetical protein NEUTE1DRAFT_134025 [Neurospora tetrasperma FGSC 2508]